MSGETILIEQLRADVERLELDLAAVAMCDSSDCGLCVSCLVSRAEKAERERDAYKRAKEENDDRFMRDRDEARAERDEARTVGEAVLSELRDFGWDHAVLRADIESERLAETVEGCVMLAIERAIRAHAKKERPVCTCTRGLGDYCPTPDPDCKAHAQKEVKP